MKDITAIFRNIYVPKKALIFFHSLDEEDIVYAESYDADENGSLINAHPLTLNECATLAETLHQSKELKKDFLKSQGLLHENILYLDTGKNGYAIWYTKAQTVNLFFKDDLGIPNGKAHIPALVWKATKNHLSVFALRENKKPTLNTSLYYAPFFNIYQDGGVCMGTVEIDIDNKCFLENFIEQWEDYFFNSKFSHLLDEYNPVSSNIVQLWQEQVNTKRTFPTTALVKNGNNLKSIIE